MTWTGVDISRSESELNERVVSCEEHDNNLQDSVDERAHISAAVGDLRDEVTAQLVAQLSKILVAVRGRSDGGAGGAEGISAGGQCGLHTNTAKAGLEQRYGVGAVGISPQGALGDEMFL